MAGYQIEIINSAKKQLDKLPDDVSLKLIDAISQLSNNPRPNGYKKLKGRSGYRIRVGFYRVIYQIMDDKLFISVVAIGHRKDIYN